MQQGNSGLALTCIVPRPEIVTLCGSVRFAAEMLAAHRTLSLHGSIVLLPALPIGEHDQSGPSAALEEVQRRKIDLADRVHVINPDGYVGESTLSEISYALDAGKPVTYEHPTAFPSSE